MHSYGSRTDRRIALQPSCETLEGRACSVDWTSRRRSSGPSPGHRLALDQDRARGDLRNHVGTRGQTGQRVRQPDQEGGQEPGRTAGQVHQRCHDLGDHSRGRSRKATILSSFTGSRTDYQAIVATGALLLPSGTLELGAILRGPNRSTAPAYYVFGIDRGSGSTLGPLFASRPGITPDSLVTITLGPNNTNPTGTITDLTTGTVTPLPATAIQAKGSTLHVYVPTAELPSTGAPVAQYRFAFWTQSLPGNNIDNVGSFSPDSSLIPIGSSAGKGLKL